MTDSPDAPSPLPPAESAARSPQPVRSDRLAVELDYDRHLSYALQQNGIPCLKGLRLQNLTGEPVTGLVVTLRTEPELAPPLTLPAVDLAPHGTWRADDLAWEPSAARLVGQMERERGTLWVEVAREDETWLATAHPLEILAWEEWPGPTSLPEILAAYVLPNHPAAADLLRKTAEGLEAATGDPTIDGYQRRDPARVRAVVEAAYGALAASGIAYAVPPASFEATGQKIRTPEQIVGQRLATCLDASVLLAALLEQAGLHPLVVLFEDHALTGVWLEEECFVDASVEEVLRIRKRVDLDSILLVEATGALATPAQPFEAAAADAKARIEAPGGFLYAVDVRAARRAGIRPLPVRASTPDAPPTESEDLALDVDDEAPELPPREPQPRVERWKRRLLDLSLRNRLLNFRPTRKTVALDVPDLARLEDRLADGKGFRLLPIAETPEDRSADAPDAESERLRELESGRLRTQTEEEDLERRLVHIYRAARLSLQEGGANTLYLALGFLRWFETPSATSPRLAPILLYPLTMTRRSVAEGVKGYRIELADDDPQVNVTLLQKLEADFEIRIPGLEAPEEDESGLDVARILDHVRHAVRGNDRWEVVDDAAVGLFSFTKYLMWLDLDKRADRLTENEVVRHLFETPDEPFGGDTSFPDPRSFDATRPPSDTYVPMPADSSQQTAIFAAADGHTFVLEGPPGTGKSQTISNLVCHGLATGKRVLFVSEKIAALEVVFKRLARAGLAPFCLELHSNKARKRAVLEQLRNALDVAGTPAPTEWPRVAERLGTVRSEVNAHTDALHAERPLGKSAFQGLARLIANADAPRVRLPFGASDAVDADRLGELETIVHEGQARLAEVGDVREHAWAASGLEDWGPTVNTRVDERSADLDRTATTVEAASAALAADLGVDPAGLSQQDLEALGRAAALLSETPGVAPALLLESAFDAVRERVGGWIVAGRALRAHEGDVGGRFDPTVLDLDLEDIRRRLEASKQTFWPLSWFKARRPKKALKRALRTGKLADTDALIADVDRAIDWRQRREELRACDAEGRERLGAHWHGLDTDWTRIESLLTWVEEVRALLAHFVQREPEHAEALRARWADRAADGKDVFAPDTAAGARRHAFAEAWDALTASRGEAEAAFVLDPVRAWGHPTDASHAPRVRAQAARWRERRSDLRAWCAWVRARRGLDEAGLAPLVEGLEAGTLSSHELEPAFEHSLYGWWVETLFEEEEVLRRFRGAEQEARIRDFRALDGDVMNVTKQVVLSRLAEGLPSGRAAAGSRSDSSEMGILHRELMKKRNIPIRRLFEKIPNVLMRLKPCLLMSPLSVAQYLGPDFPPFDLVVFDEASQIPPWDAVGAIARGEKLVVVGDSKQLPPTNFFNRSSEADEIEDEDDLQEMESILDECVAARLPRLHLGWHYRSRHESLIAFSNHHYYDDRLTTFPAAVDVSPRLGVSWMPVPEGVYDRSRTRTNRGEAEALVAYLVERLLDEKEDERSYGVVTFSMAQQSLVEDLLEDARRQHPEIERHFDDAREEPIFVKNLENVQGDERDVILMSICYGPDAEGRVALNFGPLNREGGERRLNVAITRSREQVIVFSTMRSEQIDLARTQARGARHLKAFLEYAAQGTATLGQALRPPTQDAGEASFEAQVQSALEAAGWNVVPSVGCSAYRVDLGVKDPDEEGTFLTAIETDGATYGAANTARDRHGTRPFVLKMLGWTHERVWSTDWWQDAEGETKRLLDALTQARDARRAERVAQEAEAQADAPSTDPADTDPAATAPSDTEAALPPTEPDADGPSTEPVPAVDDDVEPAPRGSIAKAPPKDEPLGLRLGGLPYQRADLGRRSTSPKSFYDDKNETRIVERIEKVIDAEAPVALGLIARRLADVWGLKRITPRLKDRVGSLVARAGNWRFGAETTDFFWRRDQAPSEYAAFRVPARGKPERRARHIPPEEVANAASALLREHVSIGAEDLARETARLFGYRRITAKVLPPMLRGVDLVVARGAAVKEDDGTVRLP